MNSRHLFISVFLIAVLVRLILNFSIPLVPGLGGGYNLVQIRSVVEEGQLAFPDMPLLFYLNALIVKLLLLIAPDFDPERMIIIVSKVIDTIGFPLILYPLFKIQKDVIRSKYLGIYLWAVAAYTALSFAPLDLACDAQKNSLGLVLMAFFTYYFLKYLVFNARKDLLLAILVLVLISLTHFGVFFISLCFVVLGGAISYRWRAVLPVTGIVVAGGLLVAVFDPERALSMVTFWLDAFTIFISPRLMYYPFGIFNFLSTILLAWIMIRVMRSRKTEMSIVERNLFLLILLFMLILAFPFYGFEYGRRLGLLLFVPQSIALLLLHKYFNRRTERIVSWVVILLVSLSVSFRLIDPKPMAITKESYTDMLLLGNEIDDPEKTIIFARHGLEWWLAWELRVRIASPHIEIDQALKEKYDQIFFLLQKKGENLIYPGSTSIFQKPEQPDNSVLIYDSEYFQMYELEWVADVSP